MKAKDTSWDRVAGWYDGLLAGEGTYQKELILPNLMRLMEIRRPSATSGPSREKILDLACGQGFFAREFVKQGAEVIGVDAARNLIELAKKNLQDQPRMERTLAIDFRVAHSDALPFIKSATIDKVAIVLALQNIENVAGTLHEVARVLKGGGAVRGSGTAGAAKSGAERAATTPSGKLYIVLNHPTFRIPKASGWGWDEAEKVQYRRIDRYLSELKMPIQMHPGEKTGESTLSFHRPLQYYVKALNKAGFSITGLEEWNSHKKSQPGPRAKAEDAARKEIPLFMCVIAQKYS